MRTPLAISIAAAFAAACLLAACSTAGNGRLVQLDAPQAAALLVPGTTTRSDVRQAFGDGAVVRFDSGFETWDYLYREGIAKGWDDVPYIGLVTSRLDHPTRELVVLFDAQGVLRRWSLQQYDDRPPRPSARACPQPSAASLPTAGLAQSNCKRYYHAMNNSERDRSVLSMAAAERAHKRAIGDGGMGDVAIYIHMRACNVMMQERLGRLLQPHNLSALGYITMMALYSRPQNLANPSELSDATGETRGNMTRICDELVDKDLVRRVPNAEDRRRVDLSLTDAGVALLNTVAPQLRKNAADFYQRNFTKTEKATLQQLLAQFSAALANDNAEL